ncbi:hypothetical protein PR048_023645 [Dryococelus australis]|uniref:Uncharacterized protein n=1 Tax=Dryococelus australis TaxID=614101 RepID=A0ABQ9GUN9_9NEOP|nr:hypothetical protein PR048_023645 [Dryococelus australis]
MSVRVEIITSLHMPDKSKEDRKDTAEHLLDRTDIRNFIGAANERLFVYSILLFMVDDTDYCFIAIDVWPYGATNSDSLVFKKSIFN